MSWVPRRATVSAFAGGKGRHPGVVLAALAPIAAFEDVVLIACKRDCVSRFHRPPEIELAIQQHRVGTVAQAAPGGTGIPLLGGVAKQGALPYQVVALDTNVGPQNVSFRLLGNKYAVVHRGKLRTALCI